MPITEITGYGGIVNAGSPLFPLLLGPDLAAATVGAPFWIVESANNDKTSQWSDEIQLNVDADFVALSAGIRYTKDRKKGPDFFSYNRAVPLELYQDRKGDKAAYNLGVNYKPTDERRCESVPGQADSLRNGENARSRAHMNEISSGGNRPAWLGDS